MKRLFWVAPFLLLLPLPWLLSGAYSYYEAPSLYPSLPSTGWTYSGTYQSVLKSGGYGGLTLYNGLMLGTGFSTQDGEIKVVHRADGGVATNDIFRIYFRATSDTNYSGSSGTYYSLEVNCWDQNLKLRKRESGTVQELASLYIGYCQDTTPIRVAHRSTGSAVMIRVYWKDDLKISYDNGPLIGGNHMGLGGNVQNWNSVIQTIALGYADSSAPTAISSGNITKAPYLNHTDLTWPAASDNGSPASEIYNYQIWRDSSLIGSTKNLSYSDATVEPGTTHNYELRAFDYHGNYAGTTFTATATAPEGRRTGLEPTGTYWGAGGENVNVMSGNLNYALPLLSAKARAGGVGLGLTYNSQNWRNDSAGNWKYGKDVGYGFGWKLLAGSITPAYSDPYTIAYYLFTDSSGAEYRLDQNASGVWSSRESIYVYYNASQQKLYSRNGSFWYFGCTSGSGEPDAGVMYPTLFQDANGNQLVIRYMGLNTSARISEIEDIRAINQSGVYKTFVFTYNSDSPVPHLTGISNTIGTGENYTIEYLSSQSLASPFDSASFGTTTFLRKVIVSGNSTYHQFTHNGSGELTEVLLPYKGKLTYAYSTTTYSNSLSSKFREVQYRYLWKDGTNSTTYTFSHETSTPAAFHTFTKLDDPGGVGQKYWEFGQSGTGAGVVTRYEGRHITGGSPVAKVRDDFTWVRDPAGRNRYISAATKTLDPGQSYEAASKTTQVLDNYGNVTEVKKYNYGDLTNAYHTSTYTYSTSSNYTSRYIFGLMLTGPGVTTITYDNGLCCSISGSPRLWDSSYASATYRGIASYVATIGAPDKSITYNALGKVVQATSNGVTTTVTTDTEYRVPVEITTGSFTSTAVYGTDFLGLTEQEGPNGDTMSVSYNGMARPTSTVSPLGATTTYTYNDTANPPTFKTTTNNKWVQSTVDGLGRTIKSEAGYSTTTVSVSEVEFDSCGCSPTGKIKKTSLPFAPGGTKIWTTYTYDGIGRTLSKLTDGTETDTSVSYVYEGNTVKVTDAANKWKKYTTDVLGRLIQVNEPNPASGSDYVTTYTYNYWGQLTGVSMPRPTGTQTRSWTYNSSLQLTSTTNPENGTVSYTYNTDRTLATKTDAKSQITQYSYDSYKRVTQTRRGTSGSSHVWNTLTASAYSPFSTGTFKLYLGATLLKQGNFSSQTYTYFYEGDMDFSQDDLRIELSNGQYMVANGLALNGTTYAPPSGCGYDCTYATAAGYTPNNVFGTSCGREDYFYDANPFNSTYSTKALGRLAAVRYWGGPCGTSDELTFVEMYGYNAPGATTKKRLRILKGTYTRDLDSTLTFNNEGQMLTMAYPNSGPTITNEYNSMGRLQKLKEGSTYLINDATYNAAGQLTFLDGVNGAPDETRAYNSIGQMKQLTIGSGLDMEYGFPATGNNGKLDYEKDLITGEKVTFTYDALNRLSSATSDVNPGWGQSFAYDGFGNNTTQTVTKGTAPSLSVTYNASTNRRTTDCADANGNIGSVSNSCSEGYTFDVLNRITAVGSSAYSYSPSNQRVWRNTSATGAEITYYGATGQKLRTFSLSSTLTVTTTGTFYYFGGKLIKNAGGFVSPDRLGSHGKYFPYGTERPSATSNDKEKFATYHRDADTGLDYAQNRYHQPGHGRFLTPDPFAGSARAGNPGSWNRYTYSGGDPVNNNDPSGLMEDYGEGGQIGCPNWELWAQTGDAADCWSGVRVGSFAAGTESRAGVFATDMGGWLGGEASQSDFMTFSTAYDVGGYGWDIPMAPDPAPQCIGYSEEEIVEEVIRADANALGIDLSIFPESTVQISNGDTGTHLSLSGASRFDIEALEGGLKDVGFITGPLAGAPHEGYEHNFRQNTFFNSMQINTNPTAGTAEIDIDPFGPGYGVGYILHGLFQVLPNAITHGDTDYSQVAYYLGLTP